MLGNGAFSKEEVERLMKAPNILQDFFKRSAELGWTVAAEQIRSTYWEIETHATRLRRMAKGWSPEPGDKVTWNPEAVRVLNSAADELDRLAKMCVRRPISELRQEAFGKSRESGPTRKVLGWRKDPRHGSPFLSWTSVVVQRHGSDWLDEVGIKLTWTPTHFSELPTDDPSVF